MPGQTSCLDDSRGYHLVKTGEWLGNYRAVKLIGQGAYGIVVKAQEAVLNMKAQTQGASRGGRFVAIKICRATQWAIDASNREEAACRLIRQHDPSGLNHCLSLSRAFPFRQHHCLVFKLMSMSLETYLRKRHPLPLRQIQEFAQQLLKGVAFLHACHIIHADLKLDNILLDLRPKHVGAQKTMKPIIRIIDFGFAVIVKDKKYQRGLVQIPPYRAPEVCLGLPWNEAIDVFAVACIIAELRYGQPLFPATLAHSDLYYLTLMLAFMGPLPDDMARRAAIRKPGYFKIDKTSKKKAPELNWYKVLTMERMVQREKRAWALKAKLQGNQSDLAFGNLLGMILPYDPRSRLSAREALKQDYFRLRIP